MTLTRYADPTRILRSRRRCEWCSEPMYTDEPIAKITNNRTRWTVHRSCGEAWRAVKRSEITDAQHTIERLTREVNSFAVVCEPEDE